MKKTVSIKAKKNSCLQLREKYLKFIASTKYEKNRTRLSQNFCRTTIIKRLYIQYFCKLTCLQHNEFSCCYNMGSDAQVLYFYFHKL